MNKLKIKLENCYGIKKLEHEFDFSDFKTFVIYAPNGAMKTSFAKTFNDVANKKMPHDQMDDQAHPACSICIDDVGKQITPEGICVINPYNGRAFDSGEKVLTLLANEEIRREYLEIYKELDSAKQSIIKNLKRISKSTNCEAELITTFSSGEGGVFEIFVAIIDSIKKSQDNFSFKYNDVFDPKGKVKAFLDENQALAY